MIIYTIALLVPLILFLIAGNRKNTQNLVLMISFSILWAIATLKTVEVGADTIAYSSYFSNVFKGILDPLSGISILNATEDTGFEYGYRLYNFIVTEFTGSFLIFSALAYAFIYYSFYRFIVKYSKDYRISFVIFYALMFFGSLVFFREYIALAILTWGYGYVLRRKFWRFIAILFAAVLFHQTSIVFLLVYLVHKFNAKYSARNLVLLGLVAAVGFAVVPQIIQLAANLSPRYGIYLDKVNSFELGSVLIMLMYLGLFVAMHTLYKKIKDKLPIDTFYLYIVAVICVISILSVRVSWFARIGDYFAFVAIIGIAHLVVRAGGVSKNFKLSIMLLAYVSLFAFATLWLKPEWLQIVPYTNIFTGRF